MQCTSRLWSALEALPSGEGVTAAWRRELGDEFGAAAPLLTPTGKLARSYPCPARPQCGCEHRVVSHASGRIVAVCRCADGDGCERIVLEPREVMMLRLDVRRLGGEVARALKFGPVVGDGRDGVVKAERIGSEGPLRSPVYLLVPEDPADALQRVSALMRVEGEPFFLLTPGGKCVTAEVRAALARHGCVHASLEGLVEVRPGGRLVAVGSLDGLRVEFGRRLSQPGKVVPVLEGIRREIAGVKAGYEENVTARTRLERAMAEGLLKFAGRIDAQSLRVIYAVLAKGDIAKAARALGMKDSTLREFIAKWKGKGKDYAVLADLVRWRKETKFTGTVPLNEAALAGQSSNMDYGALLADVLDGLLVMTEENWEEKREELAELLRGASRPGP
jgi:hypothetical protein